MKNLKPIIENLIDDIVKIRQKIHANPEIGFEEHKTAALVVNELKDLPEIKIFKDVGKTGVVAVLGAEKPGPCVALKADMDALPMQEETHLPYQSNNKGKMHACGHDGHTASLIGAAKVLSGISDELKGPVKFLFQPAEELGTGALAMCNDGALENPKVDAVFGYHSSGELNVGSVGVKTGAFMAGSHTFQITIKGIGCHAAYPHNGIDPILVAAHIITTAQTIVSRNVSPIKNAVITFSKIKGGTAANIIPEIVIITGTMRALSQEILDMIATRLKKVVNSVAESMGTTAELRLYDGFPILINNAETSHYFSEIAKKCLGEKNVKIGIDPVMGSEDFSYFSQTVPGTYWNQGHRPDDDTVLPKVHNPKFNFRDEALPSIIEVYCEVARNFFDFWEARPCR